MAALTATRRAGRATAWGIGMRQVQWTVGGRGSRSRSKRWERSISRAIPAAGLPTGRGPGTRLVSWSRVDTGKRPEAPRPQPGGGVRPALQRFSRENNGHQGPNAAPSRGDAAPLTARPLRGGRARARRSGVNRLPKSQHGVESLIYSASRGGAGAADEWGAARGTAPPPPTSPRTPQPDVGLLALAPPPRPWGLSPRGARPAPPTLSRNGARVFPLAGTRHPRDSHPAARRTPRGAAPPGPRLRPSAPAGRVPMQVYADRTDEVPDHLKQKYQDNAGRYW